MTTEHRFYTKDLQEVKISLRVLSQPDINQLVKTYKYFGLDVAERVIPAIGNEVVKSIAAEMNVDEIIFKRMEFSKLINKRLTEKGESFGLTIQDVSIVNIDVSDELKAALEKRMSIMKKYQKD